MKIQKKIFFWGGGGVGLGEGGRVGGVGGWVRVDVNAGLNPQPPSLKSTRLNTII